MILSIYGVNHQNNYDFPMTGSIMLLKVGEISLAGCSVTDSVAGCLSSCTILNNESFGAGSDTGAASH